MQSKTYLHYHQNRVVITLNVYYPIHSSMAIAYFEYQVGSHEAGLEVKSYLMLGLINDRWNVRQNVLDPLEGVL